MSHGLVAVVFDLDDTLTDHGHVGPQVTEEILRLVAGHVPDEEREAFVARHDASLEPLYDRLIRGELDEDTYQRERLSHALAPWGRPDGVTAEEYARVKRRLAEEVRPAPGAHAAVAAVKRAGLRVGVLTNGLTDLQRDKLERIGLAGEVDAFAPSQAIGAIKPEPEAFAAVARMLGARPDQLAMIGDNPVNDVDGARTAGWAHAILVGGPDGATLADAVARLGLG